MTTAYFLLCVFFALAIPLQAAAKSRAAKIPLAITKSAPSFTNVITVVASSAKETVASTRCGWKFQLSFFIFFMVRTIEMTVAVTKRMLTNKNRNSSGIRNPMEPASIMARPFARSDLLNCLTTPVLLSFLPSPSKNIWSGSEAAASLNPSSSPNTILRILSQPLVPWAVNSSIVCVPSSLMESKKALINLLLSPMSTEQIHLSMPLLILSASGSRPSEDIRRSP